MNYKRYFLLAIILITALVCLWPIYRPLDEINKAYRWYFDFLKHAGYYFVAMMLIFNIHLKINRLWQILGFFILSVLFEFLQVFSHNRTVDFLDILYNLIGIMLAVILYYLFKFIKKL